MFRKLIAGTLVGFLWLWGLVPASAVPQGPLPSPDQLDQLLAPVALYPDALLAQICAASTDPQQILDVDNWLHQNTGLSGQARTDAAQAQGFDPAFIALVNFPQVLDMMAQNIDNFATIGQVFASNQGAVMDSVQRLRQQAYASGALQSNQYQAIEVQSQGSSQVVVIQPASPQVVYVPQYNPQVVYAQSSSSAMMITSLLTFGAGSPLPYPQWIHPDLSGRRYLQGVRPRFVLDAGVAHQIAVRNIVFADSRSVRERHREVPTLLRSSQAIRSNETYLGRQTMQPGL